MLTFSLVNYLSVLRWNDWGACSVTCGGGLKLRTARECVPEYARCYQLPILEEPCNPDNCPDVPSTYFPPGSIIPWVPKPNKSFSESFNLNEDTWIICDGAATCKKGIFSGQACSDLSDRALIGAGRTGVLLDLKDASLPDHEHRHKHSGSSTYSISYKRGPDNPGSSGGVWGGSSEADWHRHDQDNGRTSVTIDFSDMEEEGGEVTNIFAPNITESRNANELYSPHMRVRYIFKCY